jgi:hypothetical protein
MYTSHETQTPLNLDVAGCGSIFTTLAFGYEDSMYVVGLFLGSVVN